MHDDECMLGVSFFNIHAPKEARRRRGGQPPCVWEHELALSREV